MAKGVNITEDIGKAFKKPNDRLINVMKEVSKTSTDRLGDMNKKQESFLKGFLKEQSPFLEQTFKFFKGDKKKERIKSMLSAKTMAPLMAKGLSLGLLKFGIGGAIGAAKLIDVTESFQEYTKKSDVNRREQSLALIDELKTGENPKSMEEIEKILKKQGFKDLEVHDTMQEYNETLEGRMKDIISQGIENESESKDVINDLVKSGGVDSHEIKNTIKVELVKVQDKLDDLASSQNINNEISVERADIEKKALSFSKQKEQNEDVRHEEMLDSERDNTKDNSSVFGGLLSGLSGLRGVFKGGFAAIGTIATSMGGLLTSLAPVATVAATAFVAFKAGGMINSDIDKMVSFVSGEKGNTLGGIIHDALSDEQGEQAVSKDKFFTTEGGKKVLDVAQRKGFEVTEDTKRKDVEQFLFEHNKKIREEKKAETEKEKLKLAEKKPTVKKVIPELVKKTPNKKLIEKAETEKKVAEKKKAKKGESVFEKYSEEEAIAMITAQALKELNINVNTGGGASSPSKLSTIPSNSDDLQLAYMSKGGSS